MEKIIEKYGLYLKHVKEEDADFILKLRTDKSKSKYISSTTNDVEEQKKWIRSYKEREKAGLEYYFIAYDENKEAFATYRIYNKTDQMIEIGSFITKQNYQNPINAIKLDVLIKEYVFETLNYDKFNFEVRKMNSTVVKYQKQFKPLLIREDEMNYYFIQNKKEFNIFKKKFKNLFLK
jgi:hypothetical protein